MVFRLQDINRYQHCPKHYYLSKQQPQTVPFPFIYFKYSLYELAQRYLQAEDIFIGQPRQTTEETLLGFANHSWLMKGRFEHADFRASLSFLKKKKNGHVVYYALCRQHYPKESITKKLALHCWLLKQCGITVDQVVLLHINAQYVRQGELDIAQLFRCSTHFFKDGNRVGKEVAGVLSRYTVDWEAVLNEMSSRELNEEEFDIPFHLGCSLKGKCDYYHHCFDERSLEDDSILFLSQTRKKYDMLSAGIDAIQDVDIDELDCSALQYAQYMAVQNGDYFADQLALSHWLQTHIQEPVSFLDFEWDTLGIPLYDGMKPYDMLPFQYSLHVRDKGQVTQFAFLEIGDAREAMIQSLLKDIPNTGSILAYNADGAEKLRLKELAQQFPQYAEALLALCDRMVDLTYPFVSGMVYLVKMRGTYSLKKLLAVLKPDHNYEELDIHHGLQAVEAYRTLEELEDEQKEQIVASMKAYCALDTYAMMVVLDYLYELAKESL